VVRVNNMEGEQERITRIFEFFFFEVPSWPCHINYANKS
jgi:hypothetical protein